MHRLSLCSLCSLWLVGSGAARAGDGAFPPDWLHGAARSKFFAYPDEGRQENDRVRNQGELDLDLTPSFAVAVPGLRAEALFRAVYDDEHLSAGVFDDRQKRRPILNAREAFLAWESGAFEARAGKQVFSWGKADIYNPTDTLNARDYADLFDNEKIGTLALSARWLAVEALAVEVVVMPFFFIPTRLPPRGARYDLVDPDLPIEVRRRRDLPDDAWRTTQVAARLSGTVPGAALDWALTAYHGYDHEPNTRLEIERLPVPPFGRPELEIFYKREDTVGLALARAVGPFELHGEAGWFSHSEKSEDEYVQYVAGANFREVDLFDESDEVFLVLEYAGLESTDDRAPGVIPGVFTTIFKSALLGRARYSIWGGEVALEATAALLMYQDDNQYYQAKAAWRALDWLKVTVGGDALAGNREGFFGQFGRDDRVFCFVEASF